MELTDSSDITTRSPLFIDLNEIPSSSTSSPPSIARPDPESNKRPKPDEFDSLDVVRSFHENQDPATGIAAGLPEEEKLLVCGACGKPEAREKDEVVVCDGCERGFHLLCAGMHGKEEVMKFLDWICGDCVNNGIKSKRWPLGVNKSKKMILDINASPPSDCDGDGDGDEERAYLRKHALGDNSFSGNTFGAPVAYSNRLYVGNGFGPFDFRKASGLMMKAFKVGVEDILHHAQTVDRSLEEIDLGFPLGRFRSSNSTANKLPSRSPNEILLQGLREFISERHGILDEGWHVELKNSVSGCEVFVAYCSPDGKTFGSMAEVACYLGLTPSTRSDGSPSLQERLHLPKKRKTKRFSLANGYAETKQALINGYHKGLLSNGQSIEIGDSKFGKVTEANMEEEDIAKSLPSDEGLPLQFEDFFVISLGKIDGRPSYHGPQLIWPVGYRSCWHDRVTGSLFICEVLDGGDSGPIFKVRRFSCSSIPIPVGSTILYRRNPYQFAGQNSKEYNDVINYDMDRDNDGSIEMILADSSPPTEDDIMTCLSYTSKKVCDVRTSDCLQRSSLHNRCGDLSSYNLGSSTWDIEDKRSIISFASLAKFCSSPSLVGIPFEYQVEVDNLATALSKWLDQDRFGLDTDFVQEVIEQLPGVDACSKYEFLANRSNYSVSLTVGNGLLSAKRKDAAELDESFQRCKKPRLGKDHETDDRYLPPGRLLCSKIPPILVGDLYQVWELLWRFHEILGLEEPWSLRELEEELVNPWFDCASLSKNLQRKVSGSQVIHIDKADGTSGPISSPCQEPLKAVSEDTTHVFIQVEKGGTNESVQYGFASGTQSKCCDVTLTEVHGSLLSVLIRELQAKVAVLVDPNFDSGELKSKRGRKKDVDSSTLIRRSKCNTLPINALTWPELARRYILAVLSMEGNLDSTEITARESGKVFRCLQGDGGVLCGSLSGVAGMEADALLLAEATRQIYGSLMRENDVLIIEDEVTDASDSCEKNSVKDGNIPEWAQMLEPVRKLPTNVGTRIRKCVYLALEKCPPEWAKKRLENSISKEVYKGNASGPTKKAVLSVLADVLGEGLSQKSNNRNKRKITVPVSDIIMKQCRIILRHAAAADDAKVFCTLLGRNLINSCDHDDEGLLGYPAMVSRPLDFRTIDLRLAVGAYGGSHESFLEDVRELWNNVRTAFRDQPDVIELVETLAQNFESLYEKEVVTLVQKFEEFAKLDRLSAETKKDLDIVLASTNEIPKAPWDEGVCKVCGFDKDDDSVLLCDTCDAEYHTYCLNPPLARIPEGNWYCPSCVSVRMVQEASVSTQVIGQNSCKKYQGEMTRIYLETLVHLASAMEEKDYWDFGVDERTFLLKFLCDELLNSALVRQHLEQCMESTAEVQQKLRTLYAEWKNLKSKEEFMALKSAKMGTGASGEVKEGLVSALKDQGKSVGQPPVLGDKPSDCCAPSDDVSAVDGSPEGNGINGFDKHPSEINYEKKPSHDSQNIDSTNNHGPVKDMHDAMEGSNDPSKENSKPLGPSQLPLSNHSTEIDQMDEAPCEGSLQTYMERDSSTLQPPSDHPGFSLSSDMNALVVLNLPSVTMNESQAYHTDVSAIKDDILRLQNLISSMESQLSKQSLRREFLGSDSRGHLYWASATPNGHPQIVVDRSLTFQHRKISHHRLGNSSVLQHSSSSGIDACLNLEGSRACFPFLFNPNGTLSMSSAWVSYETDAEIEELIGWLGNNNQKEIELKESIMQWLKLRFQESQRIRDPVQEECRAGLSTIRNNDQTAFSNCLTKATLLLEKNYGAFVELDTSDMLKKRGKKARGTNEEKTYRCDCLELIWPSRNHCYSCHRTSSNDVEFEGHSDGRCSSVPQSREKSEETNDSLKGRGNVKAEVTWKEKKSEIDKLHSSMGGLSELRARLIKFQNEGINCPYDLLDICSKFVTEDSNKELVQDIGLIGSNGIPPFVTSISPYLSDSISVLISPENNTRIPGDECNVDERQVFPQGNWNENRAVLQSSSDNSTRKTSINEIGEVLKTNKPPLGCLQRRGKKSSLGKCFPEMGPGCCCVVPESSLMPLVGKVSSILRQLKINLLDMEAALPEEALRPAKGQLGRRWAWRAYVKSAESIYQMVRATIMLEEMIKTEYLRNEWWYWSSLSAAAKTSTVASLALRIYSLDACIVYEKNSNSDPSVNLKLSSLVNQKPVNDMDLVEKCRVTRKSNKKRKEPEG
eukprot:XP_015573615.1 methyl-CpG-binding domain-containing protein 9 [Ricinus communis]